MIVKKTVKKNTRRKLKKLFVIILMTKKRNIQKMRIQKKRKAWKETK